MAGRIEERQKRRAGSGRLGGTRPVSYGDFAILLRSVKDKAGIYTRALTDRQIPVAAPEGEVFFETQEIAVMLSLLEIIDNPMQDVPLLAVLRSPVGGFSPDELARIRLADKDANFYTALRKAAETDAKCRAFLDMLGAFREAAPDMTSDRLIWHVYNKTGILGLMGALSRGETRRENLMKLLDLAAGYEQSGYKGLFGFLNLIRRLMENGFEPFEKKEAIPVDAVKIMSIHKSKGLEFPVVILADTAKRFNNRDASKHLLFHAQLGVGAKVTDLVRRIEYPTLAGWLWRKADAEMTAEELRILYVAMTRAKEKLIIVATFADAGRELLKLSKDAAAPVPPQVLENVNCLAGSFCPVLTRPEAGCLRGDGTAAPPGADSWDIRRVDADMIRGVSRRSKQQEPARVKASPEVLRIAPKARYRYPYPASASIPSS